MSSNRWQQLLTLVCVLGFGAGCNSLPASQQPKNDDNTSNYEYDGRLFKSVKDRRNESSSTWQPPAGQNSNPQAPASSGVQQTSATAELPDESSPLVKGPSSSAGPPPAIPAALPPPPSGAVSIGAIKLKEEEKKGFELSDLAPENIWKNAKKATGYGPDEKIAKAAMAEGKTLFNEKKYKEAAVKFATAAGRWPDSPLEEDALFLESESEFFSDQYSKAHDTIGGLLKSYSNTRHLDTVVAREFAMGRYWEQAYTAKPSWPVTPNLTDKSRPMFDTFGYAVQAYERVRAYDPKGPLADDSLMALGNAYFLRGQWGDAAYNYDLLCKEYPNSEHQLNAHLFLLQASMRRYQGTEYDDTPLKDSGKAAETTLAQFGDKLGPERERVLRARSQIREEKANRDFIRGQYYASRRCYGAARLYYNSVIKEFPGTECAKKAAAEIEKIRNEPDEPTGLFNSLFNSKKVSTRQSSGGGGPQ
jgi:outer membrane protein assembly factor BamD (BamD/ComL family)